MKTDLFLPNTIVGKRFPKCTAPAMDRPHTHDELELNIILSGRARYLLHNGAYELLAGTLVWLFPAQEHLLVDHARDFSMWVLVFKRALVAQAADALGDTQLSQPNPSGNWCRRLGHAEFRLLDQLVTDLTEALPPSVYNAGLHYVLARAWNITQSAPPPPPPTLVHPAVARAAQLLRGPTEESDTHQLARRCGLSRSRLSRLFREQVGISLVEYRTRQRVERFHVLRRARPSLSLLETALEAGFGSYTQCYRAIKHHTGRAPKNHEAFSKDG